MQDSKTREKPGRWNKKESGFFTVGRRGDHWWFITPSGKPFFSLGMNHIDSSTLRYPENIHIWYEKYRNDQKRWIEQAVVPDLKAWGFNTIGWTQEHELRGRTMSRHSPSFTYDEYQWANMPYCHLLPFVEFHQWEFETRLPDLFSKEFEDWCDYVARDTCARMVEDTNLIGYFYSDCPTWIHSRNPALKGPLFDPELLKTEAGKKQLLELATRYYKVTHDAIRRYDPNHLILGDRYEAVVNYKDLHAASRQYDPNETKAILPDEVLKAAVPYIDVLSFQHFGHPSRIPRDFQHWYELTGLPILLADAPSWERDVKYYPDMIKTIREIPCCVGWHYCGAYLKNRVRKYGFRDEQEKIDETFVAKISKANFETLEWVKQIAKSK